MAKISNFKYRYEINSESSRSKQLLTALGNCVHRNALKFYFCVMRKTILIWCPGPNKFIL